jgi:glycosyltransferase involved in cell wall biosynthesis
LKILHVINGLETGGAEKLLVDLIPLLQKQGHQVDLLLLNGIKTPFYDKLILLTNSNVFHLGTTYYNPFYIFKLIPYLKKYNLIHVHLFPAMYFVALAKILSLSRTKLIFTEHSTSNRRLQNKIYYPLERMIYSVYSSIICITDGVRATLEDKLKLCNDKFHVIENGIDLSLINSTLAHARSKFGYFENDKLICMVAGFRREKDQDTVVKALKLLPIDYKLIFIGEGDRLLEVKTLAKSLEVYERIIFLGVRTDVISLIKMCDIAVLSSHWEGFGLAAVEAMACGVPLIASNVEGLSEVVRGGGLLFEKGNVSELMNKIQSLENPLVYEMVCAKGIEKAQNYDISVMINKVTVLYNVIFNGKSENK